MIRGEFITITPEGDEHVVPNQFTLFGVQTVLRAAFQAVATPNLWVGLGAHNPADMIALANVQEPSVANGYARQAIPAGLVNWPVIGLVNGEAYVETREFTFPISGVLDAAVNRLFITDGAQVVSISSAFEAGLQFLSAPLITKYRLYLR